MVKRRGCLRLSLKPSQGGGVLVDRLARLLSKEKLLHVAHVTSPTLTLLAFTGVSSGVAHAQGTMDFSGAQTLMTTFKTFAMAGAVICLGGLIFAGIRMMSGRFQDAIPGLFGALFWRWSARLGSRILLVVYRQDRKSARRILAL
jgi:hypothetical protein